MAIRMLGKYLCVVLLFTATLFVTGRNSGVSHGNGD